MFTDFLNNRNKSIERINEEDISKYWFQFEIETEIQSIINPIDVYNLDLFGYLEYLNNKNDDVDYELSCFFKDIYGNLKQNEILWLMVSGSENRVYNRSFDNLDQYIEVLQVLNNKPYNLYFCPSTFSGWRKDDNA